MIREWVEGADALKLTINPTDDKLAAVYRAGKRLYMYIQINTMGC
jgi:hypothetical protein